MFLYRRHKCLQRNGVEATVHRAEHLSFTYPNDVTDVIRLGQTAIDVVANVDVALFPKTYAHGVR